MSEAPRIFVSHSHEDDTFCQRLVADLRARLGDDAVWFDTAGGLHVGDEWWDTIVREITTRPFFLVVLSSHADRSNWVQREMRIGFRQHVEQGKRLLPIRIAPSPRREDWADIHELDFIQHHDPAHYATALAELWQVLGLQSARIHTQAVADASPHSAVVPPTAPAQQQRGPERFTLLSANTLSWGVQSVAWSPNGALLAMSSDWGANVVEVATGNQVEFVSAGGHSAAWSPDGTRLATGGRGQSADANIWDTSSWKRVGRPLRHNSGTTVGCVAWAPDGSRLATGTLSRAWIWDVASGKQLVNLSTTKQAKCVAWAPDGRFLAVAVAHVFPSIGIDTMSAYIWDVTHGVWSARMDVPAKAVFSVTWAPDGRRVATGSADNTVRIWDASSGQCVAVLEGHTGWVRSVAWSPNGTYIATGSDDTTVRIWDASSRRVFATLTGHMDRVNAVAWSPDGARLATASEDRTARVWGEQ